VPKSHSQQLLEPEPTPRLQLPAPLEGLASIGPGAQQVLVGEAARMPLKLGPPFDRPAARVYRLGPFAWN
jgi:hypothetical protein